MMQKVDVGLLVFVQFGSRPKSISADKEDYEKPPSPTLTNIILGIPTPNYS